MQDGIVRSGWVFHYFFLSPGGAWPGRVGTAVVLYDPRLPIDALLLRVLYLLDPRSVDATTRLLESDDARKGT